VRPFGRRADRRRLVAGAGDRHDPKGIEPGDDSKRLFDLAGSDVALRHCPIHPEPAFLRIQLDQIIQDLLAPRLSRGSIPKTLVCSCRWRWDERPNEKGNQPLAFHQWW